MVKYKFRLIQLSSKSLPPLLPVETAPAAPQPQPEPPKKVQVADNSNKTLLDPLCHYNTSLNSKMDLHVQPGGKIKVFLGISRIKMLKLATKLTGGIRKEMILSPYSSIYLKPYIRRDSQTIPNW